MQELTQYVTELEQERVTGARHGHGHGDMVAVMGVGDTRVGDTRRWDEPQPQTRTQTQTDTPWTVTQSPSTAVTPHMEIPDPSVLVDAFFHHVYRAYPFIDEERVRKASISCVPDSRDTDAIVSCFCTCRK